MRHYTDQEIAAMTPEQRALVAKNYRLRNELLELQIGALKCGDVPGHEFHGNQWTAAHEAAIKEQRDGAARNKYKLKALKDAEKASRAIAPGTHERMADEAIARVERGLASGKPHVIDSSDMMRSENAMTRHIGSQMHDAVIDPKIHANVTLDAAMGEVQNHGKIGKMFHPEAFPAVMKMREARERLGLNDE